MNTPEHMPNVAENFADIARSLPEEASLVLSRNRVERVEDGLVKTRHIVHYEGLNNLAEMHHAQHLGRLVTDEFSAAAHQLIDSGDDISGVNYPTLTVINHTTGQKISESVDIARLIGRSDLAVYSQSARSTVKAEVLAVDTESFVRKLGQGIGIRSHAPIMMDEGMAMPLSEANLTTQTFLDRPAEDTIFDVHPRSESVIALMQMDIAQQFSRSSYKKDASPDGRSHVVVRLASQPDLQTIMLDLIDTVEVFDGKLVFRHGEIATGEIGSVFEVLQPTGEIGVLSEEATLDIALYNAYLRLHPDAAAGTP